jgi:quercetin dioxygenase-like cupin family protein
VYLVETGDSIAFGQDTWHHAFAHGPDELRVLELFAPPPSTGTSGRYAQTRPYLATNRYADDAIIGDWPQPGPRRGSLRPIRADDTHYRLAGDALVGVLFSSSQLTVATVSLSPGAVSSPQERGGDEVIYGRSGTIHVRSWFGDETFVMELHADEACFLPSGSVHEYRNYSSSTATAIVGVAPSFLPDGSG